VIHAPQRLPHIRHNTQCLSTGDNAGPQCPMCRAPQFSAVLWSNRTRDFNWISVRMTGIYKNKRGEKCWNGLHIGFFPITFFEIRYTSTLLAAV
jgi:hypothetical protein